MLYIPKINDYLEILTVEEVIFTEFTSEKQNLRLVAKLLYFFPTTPDEVQSNSSDNYIYPFNH